MADEWGPWIKHDGAGLTVPPGTVLRVCFFGQGLRPKDGAEIHVPTWPGFFWRWKRVKTGWLSSELRRVCDDPAYAPITRYQIQRPRSTAMDILREIVETPPPRTIKTPASEPVLPRRVRA